MGPGGLRDSEILHMMDYISQIRGAYPMIWRVVTLATHPMAVMARLTTWQIQGVIHNMKNRSVILFIK